MTEGDGVTGDVTIVAASATDEPSVIPTTAYRPISGRAVSRHSSKEITSKSINLTQRGDKQPYAPENTSPSTTNGTEIPVKTQEATVKVSESLVIGILIWMALLISVAVALFLVTRYDQRKPNINFDQPIDQNFRLNRLFHFNEISY